ncbi:MAG: DUF1080 domain-containing protein [Bryobacterales bacterium]|nr:DUF1080 domain-containing protein [Bryobacterales bacterium]
MGIRCEVSRRALLSALIPFVPAWAADPERKAEQWQPLFDGKTLAGWKETDFTGRGKVRVENGTIILGTGFMTGITYDKAFPVSNYELRLEAARMEGMDFFAGITFPVKESYCTWIVGGWGGVIVGLSSIDGMDASENETTSVWQFERGRFYRLRLRVTEDRITAWIDDQWAVDTYIANRTIGLRFGEIELSCPLGIASYSTTSALRKLEYRLLSADEVKAARGQ